MLTKLRRLQGRSLAELRVRATQAVNALAEQRGWSRQARVPTDAELLALLDGAQTERPPRATDELLAHFRTRAAPAFFPAFADRAGTLTELERRFGARAAATLIARAQRITEGTFDLLGLRDLRFGEPIDWHLEPVSGKRAPLVHWRRINYLDASVAGDKKLIWELNRHQYFSTLGRAYWYTRDELYAATFAAHLAAWMDENPPKLSINWASSLEVAFRAISWLWALHFFKDAPQLSPALYARALKFLYLHARHLETYLSTYFSPNTHLTGEALGLYYLGTLLPEFACAARWRATGRRILLAELDRHVRPDGVYFEQASYYHRYTTDFYTHLYVLARANGDALPRVLAQKLTALLDHLLYITRPDGTTPFFGDDDGGRLVVLDERAPNDFRAALATGAALFARADYKYVAGAASDETLWLLGHEGLRAFDVLDASAPAQTSHAFADGGYYVMRDGWSPTANYLLIDCGPHGTLNCGHAHADALAFELAAHGRTLLVDPGTYTYTGSAQMRDWFRSSAAHNTLTIDGESSSVPAGPFSWKQIAQTSLSTWLSRPRFDYFEGAHDGYMRLPAPARHTRSVLFLKDDYWIVRDRIATDGLHSYALNFHFAPDAAPLLETDVAALPALRVDQSDKTGLSIYACAADGAWRTEAGWVSPCYGARTPAPVHIFTQTATGPQDFATLLIPHAAQAARALVRVQAATGGRAFEINLRDMRDLLLLGAGGLCTTGEWSTDAACLWLRFAPHEVVPEELILLGGSRLALGAQEIFTAEAPVKYLSVRRVGAQLLVETDARGSLAFATLGAERADINGAAFELHGQRIRFDAAAPARSVSYTELDTLA
ncbi:MAG TPA: alginate lyase family protein [Pyrinomonadaceae bacterium]